MKPDRNASVLLTGASGVVGSALLDELDDVPVTCLVHRTPPGRPCAGHVRGDITRPRLGLSPEDYAHLLTTTGTIVHAAAETDFTAGEEATRELNVAGTANVIELAERTGARLIHVSTAFVARAARLRDAEGEGGGPSAYLQSKLAAEQLVRESGVPSTIVRPSVVVGDSHTGEIAAFQGLHAIAGAVIKGALPMVPLTPDSVVDFVPQDFVARAIAALVRSGEAGGEHWLTAGERALRASQMLDAALQVAAWFGRRVDKPRFIAPDAVDRLIRPVFIEPLPEAARRRFDQLLNMTALFAADVEFPSSAGELEQRLGVALPDDLRATFVRSLEYWGTRKGLEPPVAETETELVPA